LKTLCTYESDEKSFRAMNEWAEFVKFSEYEHNYDFKQHPLFGLSYFKDVASKALINAEALIEQQFMRACSVDQAAFLNHELAETEISSRFDFPIISRNPDTDFRDFFRKSFSFAAYRLLDISFGDDLDLAISFIRLKNWLSLNNSLIRTHNYYLYLHPSIGSDTLREYLEEFMQRKVRALWAAYRANNKPGYSSEMPKVLGDEFNQFISVLKADQADPWFLECYDTMAAVFKFKEHMASDYQLKVKDPFFVEVFDRALAGCRSRMTVKKRDASPRRRRSTRTKK